MKGVKIPYSSKINPLSHRLTFTEAWSVGVCEGGCPALCMLCLCACACVCERVCEVFLHLREKLHWFKLVPLSQCQVQTRVRKKLGFSTGIQLYVWVCLRVSHVCIERYDVFKVCESCLIGRGNLFSWCWKGSDTRLEAQCLSSDNAPQQRFNKTTSPRC